MSGRMSPGRLLAVVLLILIIIGSLRTEFGKATAPSVPADQQAFINLFNKYTQMYVTAPNSLQQQPIMTKFYTEYCSEVPTGHVSGWLGKITNIQSDYDNDNNIIGVTLTLDFPKGLLQEGPFTAGDFTFSNETPAGYEINWQESEDTTKISAGTALYNAISNMRSGDNVIFSGDFIAYKTTNDCMENIKFFQNDFALIRFLSVQDTGQ